MQREIKFKAVFYNEDIDEKIVSVNSFTIEQLASCNEHVWEFSDGGTLPANDVDGGNLEYIEFTGLLDKNGVEIYEGGILKSAPTGFATKDFTYQVKWEEPNSCGCCGESSGWNVDMRMLSKVEVIGNIYENPELLKELDEYTK